MFSTFGENNSFPLSYYHSPSLTNQESNTTYLQQTYHQNLFQGPYNYMPSFINPSICENPMNNYSIPHHSSSKFILEDSIDPKNTLLNCPFDVNNDSHTSKRAVAKKDRHTKISTAQGVRDRRVRLSISIAREFFNLQDMLGFDKASKTLGWLLGKSKAAIDELASSLKNNNGTSKCSSSASENEIAAIDQNTIEEENEKQNLSGKTIRKKRGRKVHNGKSCNGEINAREVRREKARERARERTKNKKMMVSNLNNHQMMENSSSSSPHHQHNHHHYHQRDQQNLMICQSSCSYDQINPTIKVGESVVIKSKYLKESCHNRDHDINFNDYQEGCNYNSDDDLTKFAFESNGGFPSLNINNLSTEIHINAKPWETSSNQILH